MVAELNWNEIDTVLLDMDGTLIDLEFDSYFWQVLIPKLLSKQHNITFNDAHQYVKNEYLAVQHSLQWYCFDYWSKRLSLDIHAITTEVGHRARLRDDTIPFLKALRAKGCQTILLTNAHPYSLQVKVAHTKLNDYLDRLISSHTFGYPKEDSQLWQAAQQEIGFNPQRTLFVDDNEFILDIANKFGIRYCLGVENPDSSAQEQTFKHHPSTRDYRQFIPAIKNAQLKG